MEIVDYGFTHLVYLQPFCDFKTTKDLYNE